MSGYTGKRKGNHRGSLWIRGMEREVSRVPDVAESEGRNPWIREEGGYASCGEVTIDVKAIMSQTGALVRETCAKDQVVFWGLADVTPRA
jgi:hypothetical protein